MSESIELANTSRLSRAEKKVKKRERLTQFYKDEKDRKKAAKRENRPNSHIQEKSEVLSARSERKLMDRIDSAIISERHPTILLDCDFSQLMTDRELTSLTQQINYSYGIIKKCSNQPRLALCGLSESHAEKVRNIPGISAWNIRIYDNIGSDSLPVDVKNMVYLSADTDETFDLSSIASDSVIIIGGLVDRNRHKGITHAKATALGIKTASLPLGDYVQMSSSKVITVNQVVDIIANAYNDKSWTNVIQRVIPGRKIL